MHSTNLYHRLYEVSMEILLSEAEQGLFNEHHNTPSLRGHLRSKASTDTTYLQISAYLVDRAGPIGAVPSTTAHLHHMLILGCAVQNHVGL